MKKNNYKTLIVIAGLGISSGAIAQSEHKKNQGFTYFGLGTGSLYYTESATLSSGIKIKTESTTYRVFQKSGGHTSINENFGFYIKTASTLDSGSDSESWTATGRNDPYSVDGVYQTDSNSSINNELELLGSYLAAPRHQWLAGFRFNQTVFSRASFKADAATDDFNNTHLYPASFEKNGSGKTLEELKTLYGVNHDKIQTVTEDQISLSLMMGYQYDTLFSADNLGLRLTAGMMAGIPIYSQVKNSSFVGEDFQDYLGGYDVNANLGAGWQFSDNFGLLTALDYSFRLRDEQRVRLGHNEDLQRDVHAVIPENRLRLLKISLAANWKF